MHILIILHSNSKTDIKKETFTLKLFIKKLCGYNNYQIIKILLRYFAQFMPCVCKGYEYIIVYLVEEIL